MGRHLPDALRFQILQRDAFTCVFCGAKKGEPNVRLEVDHIVPYSSGGTDDPSNLQTTCRTCNRGKGTSELASTPRPTKTEIRQWHAKNGASNGRTAAHFGLAVDTIRRMLSGKGVAEEEPEDPELEEDRTAELWGDPDDVIGNLRQAARIRAHRLAQPDSINDKNQQSMAITMAIIVDKADLADQVTRNEQQRTEADAQLDEAVSAAFGRGR